MYERMLNKQVTPTIEEMTTFCGENAERFTLLNEWLLNVFPLAFKWFQQKRSGKEITSEGTI